MPVRLTDTAINKAMKAVADGTRRDLADAGLSGPPFAVDAGGYRDLGSGLSGSARAHAALPHRELSREGCKRSAKRRAGTPHAGEARGRRSHSRAATRARHRRGSQGRNRDPGCRAGHIRGEARQPTAGVARESQTDKLGIQGTPGPACYDTDPGGPANGCGQLRLPEISGVRGAHHPPRLEVGGAARPEICTAGVGEPLDIGDR